MPKLESAIWFDGNLEQVFQRRPCYRGASYAELKHVRVDSSADLASEAVRKLDIDRHFIAGRDIHDFRVLYVGRFRVIRAGGQRSREDEVTARWDALHPIV